MSIKKLSEIAESKGYQIGKDGKYKYYYSWVHKGRTYDREFRGTFLEFAKFVIDEL